MTGVTRFLAESLPATEAAITPIPKAAFKAPTKAKLRAALQAKPTTFGLRNTRAADWLDTHGARLVADVDDVTRDALRGIVADGRVDGLSPSNIAQQILDRFPQMAEGRPQEHIESRAHGIAVTETAFAYEAGQRGTADHIASQGVPMLKAWLTVADDRVDEDCDGNEAAGWIDLDGTFPDGSSEPPAHPYCRCTAEYRVDPDWLAEPDNAVPPVEADLAPAPEEPAAPEPPPAPDAVTIEPPPEVGPPPSEPAPPEPPPEPAPPPEPPPMPEWPEYPPEPPMYEPHDASAFSPIVDQTTDPYNKDTGRAIANELDRWTDAHGGTVVDGRDLSDFSQTAFTDYSESGYLRMNELLRGDADLADVTEQTLGQVAAIEANMGRLGEDVTLYRGIGSGDLTPLLGMDDVPIITERLDALEAFLQPGGAIWHDDAFSSASVHVGVGRSFGDVLLHINAPAGTAFRYMDRTLSPSNWGEHEFLLGRGATFVVRSVEREGSTAWGMAQRLIVHVDLYQEATDLATIERDILAKAGKSLADLGVRSVSTFGPG